MTPMIPDRIQCAREGFAGPLNCAQAVAVAFQDVSGLAREQLETHSRKGGGKAPGGICGALHAALEVLPEDTRRELLTTRFAEVAGSTLCHEIKKMKKASCACCVESAATFLTAALDDKK